MQDLIPYFWNSGAAADGLHNRLSGVFWWAWNSNSGAPHCIEEVSTQAARGRSCWHAK